MLWMKNTEGKPDAVLTMAFLGFLVVLIKLLVAGGTLTIGSTVLTAGSVDAAMVAAVLTPTLGAYVARRYTDQKFAAAKPVEQVAEKLVDRPK